MSGGLWSAAAVAKRIYGHVWGAEDMGRERFGSGFSDEVWDT